MTVMTKYEPGTFCWADLATLDPNAAKAFYGELFGWTFEDWPSGPNMTYTMAARDGATVAALFLMSPEESGMNIPPHWNAYVSVDDVDATAKKVEALGGRLLMPPFDVLEVGRMVAFVDPTGASVAAWQAKRHIGASLLAEPGAICWNELLTTDVARASAFYTGLFGWTTATMPMGNHDYTLLQRPVSGAEPVNAGGILPIEPSWGPVPPVWSVYFQVEDTDAAIAKATRLGGKVLVPAQDVPNVGRFAGLTDPQGASFWIIAAPKP